MAKCAHCRKPGATETWDIWACADGRKHRARLLCRPCDIDLNCQLLTFFNDPKAAEKIAAYREAESTP